MNQSASFVLFGLDGNSGLASGVAARLGVELAPFELRVFADTEIKIRPLASVRARHAYVLASLAQEGDVSVNEQLCRLLFFVGALYDAGAASVTVLFPYLGYARKDRRTKARDPLTSRYIAQLLEAIGLSRVAAFEAHSEAAFANAFRCPAEHLESAKLLATRVGPALAGEDVAIVSPDAGGAARAARFALALSRINHIEPTLAFVEKRRSRDRLSGGTIVGDVEGRTAVIVDDMIVTGGTLAQAAEACQARGAQRVLVAAAHGLFATEARERLSLAPIERLYVTNSVVIPPISTQTLSKKLVVVDASPLLAHAIFAMQSGSSLSETRTYS